ncbi:MAG: COR domain-containing protein [Candidatus Omnitrophota bacterium]
MERKYYADFNWSDLLARIAMKNVIPIIGEELYWVHTPDEGEVLLYSYLAKKFAEEMALPIIPNETFHQAAFRYLEQNPYEYLNVNHFLTRQLEMISPITDGPLWKLAKIKNFSLFINITYDNYLYQMLKNVRSHPVETIHYNSHDKWSPLLPERSLFKTLKEGQHSLIFNIYGNADYSMAPAYTEKDIMETIVMLQKDMETDRENIFFQTLEKSSLLFIGCGYEDWLFRFFIRSLTNNPIKESITSHIFINDKLDNFNSTQINNFFRTFEPKAILKVDSKDFVDILFRKIEERNPEDIIEEDKFPGKVFLSFYGRNRIAAKRLAENLKEDGIPVWFDEWELRLGAAFEETISKALSECSTFIPIISKETQRLNIKERKSLDYVAREWEWAYGQTIKGENPRHIIPVIIDDTNWMFGPFQRFMPLKISNGERQGDYKRLIDYLLKGNYYNKTINQIEEREEILAYSMPINLKIGTYLPLNEVKLLILGDGGAGKTSLVNSLLRKGFDENEIKTPGININNWKFKVGKNTSETQVHIWDFGGQEILQSTHQIFLSKRSLYILVLDARTEGKHEYWFKYIEAFGGDSPILVVLNKIDLNPDFEVNGKYLRDKYKNIVDFHRISCKTGAGIGNLLPKIETAILKVEFYKTQWQSNWLNAKKHLETIKDPFISINKFKDICIEQGIIEESDQIKFADSLNDLGIFLHYKDIELEDTYVLNPRWVTEGIYALTNSKEIKEKKGILNTIEVKEIFKSIENYSDYPPDKYKYIVYLMKKFQLCFEIKNGVLLLPSLLQTEECIFEFDYKDSIKFVYRYDFLPKTVMPKFIVLKHKYIKENLLWRSGVVLEVKEDECKSIILVKLEEEDKKISIYISGDQKQFQLSKIRDVFKEIHESYEKLRITEYVPLPDIPNEVIEYRELKGLKAMGKKKLTIGRLRREYQVDYLLNGIEKEEQVEENRGGDAINIYVNKQQEIGKMINVQVGNVTMNNGDFVVAENIKNSFNKVESSNVNVELKELLKALTESVAKMSEQLTPESAQNVSEDLNTFNNEATKDKPRKKWWELSAAGIKDAAISVGKLGGSVIKILEEIIPILNKIS